MKREIERRTCLRSKRVKDLRQLKTSQWLAWESGWRGMTRQPGQQGKCKQERGPSTDVSGGGLRGVRFPGADERRGRKKGKEALQEEWRC